MKFDTILKNFESIQGLPKLILIRLKSLHARDWIESWSLDEDWYNLKNNGHIPERLNDTIQNILRIFESTQIVKITQTTRDKEW